MESEGRLEKLATGIRSRLEEVHPDGPQDRKAFRSHLTVARIKRPLPPALRRLPSTIQLGEWEPVDVTAFHLIESELRPTGPRYTERAVFPLGPTG
jgi:2'-5' RNA ligase